MSMLFLADAIRRGDRYRIDLEKSERWYKRAASLGSGRAMYGLGLVHLARRDLQNAIEAWRSAGERGCGAAMWVLGRLHLHGDGDGGGAPDAGAARAFFERGASLGHVWSTRSLALLLMTGRFGLGQRLRGYDKYLRCFVAMAFAMLGKRVDPVMR
ncbi:tetratricopeptide repeat protein [Phenylobacterium sp.]|uniref:tetratricopeptide repeat protein n=1 Tax=Phenylobacterium sp. TaxID=1871053 RepID=UPI0035656D4E